MVILMKAKQFLQTFLCIMLFLPSYIYPTKSNLFEIKADSNIENITSISTIHIISDGQEKYSKSLLTGWETSSFDDSLWLYTLAPSGGLCPPSSVSRIPNSEALPSWAQNPQAHDTIYVRKTFYVQDPISATISTLVDDDYDLYVNGILVRSDWNGRWSYYVDDISSIIHSGKNTIAIKATDTSGGCQSIAFDVKVNQSLPILDTGLISPTQSINDDGNWTNMANAYTDDNTSSRSAFQNNKAGRWLGYKISIPPNALVTGVEVRVDASTGFGVGWLEVEVSDGSSSSSARKVPCCLGDSVPLTQTKTEYNLGGQNDFWGMNWTPQNINNIQVRVRVVNLNDEQLLWWVPVKVYYQLASYSISGQVVDIGGNPYKGITITDGTGHGAVSDNNGAYTIDNLPPGEYTLAASFPGKVFTPLTHSVIIKDAPIIGKIFSEVNMNCAEATAMPPIMLVNGWGGSIFDQTIAQDENLNHLYKNLWKHGYVENCNLFLAHGTSPAQNNIMNAAAIKQEMCIDKEYVSSNYPGWNGSFDIIAHSYGGLRSRGYLESPELYYHPCADGSTAPTVRNLITLGTPHNGDIPTLPLSFLLFLNSVTETKLGYSNIPAILELLPHTRVIYNYSHAQFNGIHYYLIAGDVRSQIVQPIPFGVFFPEYISTPSDMAVHLNSGISPDLLPQYYPRTQRIITNDVHGRNDHALLFWLNLLKSYVEPSDTFDNYIWPIINGQNYASGSSINFKPNLLTTENMIDHLNDTVATPNLAQQEITSGFLEDTQVVTGTFEINDPTDTGLFLNWSAGSVDLLLIDPSGNFVEKDESYQRFNGGFGWVASYYLQTPQLGTWTYLISGQALVEPEVYRLSALYTTPIILESQLPQWLENNVPLIITANVVIDGNTFIQGGTITTRINRPDNTYEEIILQDDGAHQDGLANDGTYGGIYSNTSLGGYYGVQITASGTFNNTPFTRTTSGTVQVSPSSARLGIEYSDQAIDDNEDGVIETLEIMAPVEVQMAGEYSLSADLYAGESFIAHAIINKDLNIGSQSIVLSFDGHSIFQKNLDGPYTVQNVFFSQEGDYTLLIQSEENVFTTGPYKYRDFGNLVFIPMINR